MGSDRGGRPLRRPTGPVQSVLTSITATAAPRFTGGGRTVFRVTTRSHLSPLHRHNDTMNVMTLDPRSAEARDRAPTLGDPALESLFVGLVRDYQQRIFNYLLRIVGDTGAAEDLCQEVYLRAYRSLARLDSAANHRAWLYRIATNAAMDELRRRKRRPWDVLGLTNLLRAPSPSEDERLNRVVLDQAMLRIGAEHRAVLSLFEYAGLTAPQVAEVLGITPEAARKRRQRAREALAAVLGVERDGGA